MCMCLWKLLQVVHSFEAEGTGELSLRAGDYVVVRQVGGGPLGHTPLGLPGNHCPSFAQGRKMLHNGRPELEREALV